MTDSSGRRHEIGQHLLATVDAGASESDLATVEQGLIDHARLSGVEPRDHRPLVITLRHADEGMVGGLVGETVWGWLQIKQVWIAEPFRRRGLGRKLLLLAEGEAARRGCHHAMLDTFDFHAPAFYAALGYGVFGRLDDLPRGHTRYFVAQRLGG